MLVSLLLSLLLSGTISNEKGRLGILLNKASHSVIKVYKHSPSQGLIQKGDKILSVDGVDGVEEAITTVGTEATVVVERDGKTMIFKIIRASYREVYD